MDRDAELAKFERLAEQSVVLDRRLGVLIVSLASLFSLLIAIPICWANSAPGWVFIVTLLAWLTFSVLLWCGAWFWPAVEYRHASWRLDDIGLEIRRGVLWKHRISIPTSRVQHVDVSQGPLQRWFSLGTLTVHTAGTKHASIELGGLEHSRALQIRDELMLQREGLDVL